MPVPPEADLVPCQYAENGSAQTFAEGGTSTVEACWAGEWRVDKPFMKYFALSIAQAGAR